MPIMQFAYHLAQFLVSFCKIRKRNCVLMTTRVTLC
jgi:hypothetical protein